MGVDLDIGRIPPYTDLDPTEEDPERPARILAHALARASDRFPLLRKVSRQVEGTDAKAGLGSDILAALWEMGVRNQSQIEDFARHYVDARAAHRAANGTAPHKSRFSRKQTNTEEHAQ